MTDWRGSLLSLALTFVFQADDPARPHFEGLAAQIEEREYQRWQHDLEAIAAASADIGEWTGGFQINRLQVGRADVRWPRQAMSLFDLSSFDDRSTRARAGLLGIEVTDRYFDAMRRMGASTMQDEIQGCEINYWRGALLTGRASALPGCAVAVESLIAQASNDARDASTLDLCRHEYLRALRDRLWAIRQPRLREDPVASFVYGHISVEEAAFHMSRDLREIGAVVRLNALTIKHSCTTLSPEQALRLNAAWLKAAFLGYWSIPLDPRAKRYLERGDVAEALKHDLRSLLAKVNEQRVAHFEELMTMLMRATDENELLECARAVVVAQAANRPLEGPEYPFFHDFRLRVQQPWRPDAGLERAIDDLLLRMQEAPGDDGK